MLERKGPKIYTVCTVATSAERVFGAEAIKAIGSVVKDIRRKRVPKMTQPELAKSAGLSPSTIKNLERGTAEGMSLETLLAIAKALGVGADALLRPTSTDGPRLVAAYKKSAYFDLDDPSKDELRWLVETPSPEHFGDDLAATAHFLLAARRAMSAHGRH